MSLAYGFQFSTVTLQCPGLYEKLGKLCISYRGLVGIVIPSR